MPSARVRRDPITYPAPGGRTSSSCENALGTIERLERTIGAWRIGRAPRIIAHANHDHMIPNEPVARRTFLIDAARLAAAGFLTVELQLLAGCARDNDRRDGPFANLTPAEGRTMRALAAQIIPAEGDLPGAEQAGVVYFIDRAAGMPFFAESALTIRRGLADLDARAKGTTRHQDFASASDAEQIALMREIETTPFFAAARTMVVIGMFSDPSYGGNRGEAGWALLGAEHRPSNSAPFGWYDAHPFPDVTSGTA